MIEQRKTVSVVFADLVESTSLAERLDPEQLAGILRRYFATLRSVIEGHGGTVEKFIGDAVVGVFGVPVLHEDDALRAVRAALGMQDALRTLNTQLVSSLQTELRIRVGVNTGEVIVSADNALGHAISMAARLEQNADASDVLIGKETFALVATHVDAEPVQPLAIKGSSEPLPAWRVTGLRDVPSGSRTASRYVGRELELQAIATAFTSAVEQRTCVSVTVVAPPGIGKSRLLAEATGHLSENPRVIGGACLPYGEIIAYAPLIEAVRQLEANEPNTLDRLVGSQSDGAQVVARIRATMAGAAHGSPDETAWAFRRLFDTLAADRALVVVLDDLHWADSLLLDLVEYVVTFSVGRPILLLCAARPDLFDSRPGWSTSSANAQLLRLAPLTEAQTEALMAGLETDALDPDTRRRIMDAAAGVPLFVEQMAAFDAEVGGHALVPPTIRALLAARVDRLPADERAVLEHAAIEGPIFHRDTLAELMPSDARDSLGSQLMMLIRREFIQPQQALDGRDAFGFNHALIRDAIYDAIPRRSRAELHERFATLLRGGAQQVDEVIGHHLEHAYLEREALGETGAADAGAVPASRSGAGRSRPQGDGSQGVQPSRGAVGERQRAAARVSVGTGPSATGPDRRARRRPGP